MAGFRRSIVITHGRVKCATKIRDYGIIIRSLFVRPPAHNEKKNTIIIRLFKNVFENRERSRH